MSFNSVTGVLTGGAIDPSTPNYAGAAAAANRKAQAQIDQGQAAINAAYFGGSYPMYSQAGGQFNPGTVYYSTGKAGDYVPTVVGTTGKKGKPTGKWVTSGMNFGGGRGKTQGQLINFGPNGQGNGQGNMGAGNQPFANNSPLNRTGEELGTLLGGAGLPTVVSGLLGGLFGGNSAPTPQQYLKGGKLYQKTDSPYQTGFTPAFYQGIQNDYIQAAMPQLAQQQQSASDAIKYGLFNKGINTGSSAYGTGMSQLDQTTGQAEQQVADSAKSAAQTTQQNVMNSYQNAINNLYSSTNPTQSAQSGIQSAAQFNVPQTFAPIANAFSGLANQYATNLLYSGAPVGGFNQPGAGGTLNTQFLGPTASY